MSLEVIILAAGKGTRMCSPLPKVLHKVGGKEMINHLIDTASMLSPEKIHVVYGFGGELVRETVNNPSIDWVLQKQILGTANAVQQVMPSVKRDSNVLILVSDIPLISLNTMKCLVDSLPEKGIGVLVANVENPSGLGRIIKNSSGKIIAIKEDKDCSDNERLIKEINTGVIAGNAEVISMLLSNVKNNNAQKEYYLTDIISIACSNKIPVSTSVAIDAREVEGINDKIQLARAERYYQKRLINQYMKDGLIVIDPARIDIRGSLEFGSNTTLDANVIIQGHVVLGNNVVIGAGSVLTDCKIDDNSVLQPYTVIEGSVIGKGATLGPFCRFRPGSVLEENVHVGNFVEVKKSHLGKGTKSGHLTYLGDSEIGENVNIGAGTITCNYDGANKWQTKIGNNVFVGSDTQIVAPAVIEDDVTIGAGTTVTKHVDKGMLVISRTPMRCINGWKRPTKIKK